MQRKIFLAVDVDQKTKKFVNKKIEMLEKKWENIEVRWIDSKNYHLTLFFVGYLNDSALIDLIPKIKNKLTSLNSFDILMNEISFSPVNKTPKMFWLKGEKNENLINLVKIIREIFEEKSERKEFNPHINLGKIKGLKSKDDIVKNPDFFKEKVIISIPVSEIKLLESRTERGKQSYFQIDSIMLN